MSDENALKKPTKVPNRNMRMRNCLLVPTFLRLTQKGSSAVSSRASAAEGEGGVGGRSDMKRTGTMATIDKIAQTSTEVDMESLSVVMTGMINWARAAAKALETDPIMVAVVRPSSENQTAAYLGGAFKKKG